MREREVVELLRKVTDTFPNTEERQGQNDMAMAVSNAVNTNRHLIVQAGTGTGKHLVIWCRSSLPANELWFLPTQRLCKTNLRHTTYHSSFPSWSASLIEQLRGLF